ncbi:MAG: DUF4384 domain-containing protein [Gemmatimonadetes bacterium]|nr:DUF4384 domain-containing protein [Gemmatimonadota bacterium]
MSAALLLALTALTISGPAPTPTPPDAIIARWVRGTSTDRPRINVWLNRDDVYNRGDNARVYFKSDQDAYVTILRVDTDGRIRVLFPIDPWEDNWARGGRTFEVLGRERDEAFRVDDYPGVGYLFAIASEDPFNYDDLVRGDHWDYRAISDGRVRGDPYVAVADLAERIGQADAYDYDVAEYNVERHYDYPRFVCYDCHTYASWRYWDPYSHYCSRFRIVIYDDWYYYPYRHYRGGTVIVRPYRPGPRYVFKDYDQRNDYITRVAERPRVPEDRRPVIDRDRTSADVGGRGSVPAPVSPRRRTGEPATPGATSPNATPRRRTPEAGTPTAPQSDGNRRRPSDQPSAPQARPESSSEPRRRNEPDQTREPASTTREQPGSGSTPRRRPSGESGGGLRDTGEDRDNGNGARESAPRRSPVESQPRDSRGSQDNGSAREPRRDTPNDAPRSTPREAPRSAPPAARPQSEPRAQPSQPRSTGQPELRRRRPN